jgi:hypothetical protein
MTIDELRARFDQVVKEHGPKEGGRENRHGWDNGCAHIEEDEIYSDVFRAIRDGATNAAELAAECVKFQELPFARWYE